MKSKSSTDTTEKNLKERVLDALILYDSHVELSNLKEDSQEFYEIHHLSSENPIWQEISDRTEVLVRLEDSDDEQEMTIGEFLEITDEVSRACKQGGFSHDSLYTHKRLLCVVGFSDNTSYERVSSLDEPVVKDSTLGLSVSLLSGFSAFTLAMMIEGRDCFDELNPPFSDHDYLIEVTWAPDKQESRSICEDHVEAFIFALHEELSVNVHRSSRPNFAPEDFESPSGDRKGISRPLMTGSGMRQLLAAYNKSQASGDVEFEYLQIAKAIEFVSATVVRRAAHQEIRMRLNSPAALHPTAIYISGLIELVAKQQLRSKDFEAIKLTIMTCCDADELAALAPKCAKMMCGLVKASGQHPKKNVPAPQEALSELAAIIYHTRCQFSHEKANYTMRGDECPPEQLEQLIKCARVVARQCIRWYNDLGENERMFTL